MPQDVVYLQFCYLCQFFNCMLVAVVQVGFGIELTDGSKVGGLLFANDYCVGVSESDEQLKRVVDVVHSLLEVETEG